MEGMLEDFYTKLVPEVFVAEGTRQNEERSPIYELSDDLLGLCLGYVGDEHYRFVAGTSARFHSVYINVFGVYKNPAWTTSPCRCPVQIYALKKGLFHGMYYTMRPVMEIQTHCNRPRKLDMF